MTPELPPPLAGLRVLDFSQGMAGPNCGTQFALYGADVIKIEPPEGDWVRRIGRAFGQHSAISIAVNRGKRSIALDLKNPAARHVVDRLVAGADVLIENNRPGVAERLGIGYERLAGLNPRLVYLSMTGYGQTGPYAGKVSTDTVAQAFSGMMSCTRDSEGRPMKIGFLVVDAVASLYAFQAATMALFRRFATGRGEHIDASLLAATAALLTHKVVECGLEGERPRALNVPAGNYRTADGWISISLMREQNFEAICRVIGRLELPKDPRFANFESRAHHADEITALIAEQIIKRPTADWLKDFAAADVLCAKVNTITDWLEDKHVKAVNAVTRIDQPGVGIVPVPQLPGMMPDEDQPPTTAPGIGEHGRDILTMLGYSPAEIAQLEASAAVRLPSSEIAPKRG